MLAQRNLLKNSLNLLSKQQKIPSTNITTPRCTPIHHHQNTPTLTPTINRNIHFLPLLGIWGAKHLSTWTLYNACKQYGWHKVYKRLLEQNRLFNKSNPAIQSQTQTFIRMAIEVPPKFAVEISKYGEIIILPFLKQVVDRAVPSMPSFLVVMARFIVGSQKPVKIMQDLAGAAAKAAK